MLLGKDCVKRECFPIQTTQGKHNKSNQGSGTLWCLWLGRPGVNYPWVSPMFSSMKWSCRWSFQKQSESWLGSRAGSWPSVVIREWKLWASTHCDSRVSKVVKMQAQHSRELYTLPLSEGHWLWSSFCPPSNKREHKTSIRPILNLKQ